MPKKTVKVGQKNDLLNFTEIETFAKNFKARINKSDYSDEVKYNIARQIGQVTGALTQIKFYIDLDRQTKEKEVNINKERVPGANWWNEDKKEVAKAKISLEKTKAIESVEKNYKKDVEKIQEGMKKT